MLHVKMLLICLITISISGCSKEECKPIPQKCIVPYTDEPTIDNENCDNNTTCTIKKALKNYEAQKDYAERLKNNSEVCR